MSMAIGRTVRAGARCASLGARWRHSSASFDLVRCRAEIAQRHAREGPSGPAWDDQRAKWCWLDRELSSNIAGETGAVAIYDGAAAGLQLRSSLGASDGSSSTLEFIRSHREAEASHLALFEALLPQSKRTRLLPVWRVAGFSLGFLPAAVSPRALFVTVEAVETFVEQHYQSQIGPLQSEGSAPELVRLLSHCCEEEVIHKEDAARRAAAGGVDRARSLVERGWGAIVRAGSAVAAECARRV
jgi:ubiquinone biosynthesis monooxygenase Coq7